MLKFVINLKHFQNSRQKQNPIFLERSSLKVLHEKNLVFECFSLIIIHYAHKWVKYKKVEMAMATHGQKGIRVLFRQSSRCWASRLLADEWGHG